MKIVCKSSTDFVGVYETYYWFVIVAKNGKILATSEMYKTRRARNKAALLIIAPGESWSMEGAWK